MAAKKRSSPDLAAILASSPYPESAAGLGRANGLGVNPGVDAFLGLGFPYLIIPTDEPIGTYETCAEFAKAFPRDANVMPRVAIEQEYFITVPATDDTPFTTPESPLPEVQKIALATAVKRVLAFGNGRHIQQLEALFGSLPVAEELVTQLAKLPKEGWHATGIPAVVSAGLRYLLWRVAGPDRKRLQGTLRATFDAIDAGSSGGKALDVLLNGREGVERSGGNFNGELHLYDLVSAEDDPEWACAKALKKLERLRPADREHFNPQLVVLCGKKLLEAFRASVAKFPADHRKRMTELLALFADG